MRKKKKNPKLTLYAIVIILAIASIAFRLLNKWGLEQTSFLFIGIPALLALLVIKYSNRPKTPYAIMFYVVSIFLLLCGVFLGEGLICIIIMSPLFYGIGALVVAINNRLSKHDKQNLNVFILTPILLLMGQFYEMKSIPETHSITTTFITTKDTKLTALNSSPNFQNNLPSFFKIGFPKPISVYGQGIKVDDTRTIKFLSNTKGMGELKLQIKEASEKKLVFDVVYDNTHIAHWLSYKEITVTIDEKGDTTEITWTTNFTCDLGPSWYFQPMEKAAINLMNEHLLHSYFGK